MCEEQKAVRVDSWVDSRDHSCWAQVSIRGPVSLLLRASMLLVQPDEILIKVVEELDLDSAMRAAAADRRLRARETLHAARVD